MSWIKYDKKKPKSFEHLFCKFGCLQKMSFNQPLSEYELLRQRNIEERDRMWQEMLLAKAEFNQDLPVKQVRNRVKQASNVNPVVRPLKRSSRLKGMVFMEQTYKMIKFPHEKHL